jgi:hypothetical protein
MLSTKKVESKNNKFLKIFNEKEDINQYWFSEQTINFIIQQIEKQTNTNSKIAFVSCPSIFFSCSPEIQEKSILFDYDERFPKRHKNAVKFDFNDFSNISEEFHHKFDFIVIDPPFITEKVWTLYAEFAKLISIMNETKTDISSKIIACSISENKEMLNRLINLQIKKYQPSIPHLVYQYNFFANFDDEELDQSNKEIPSDY